jgi:hypothetical protein
MRKKETQKKIFKELFLNKILNTFFILKNLFSIFENKFALNLKNKLFL